MRRIIPPMMVLMILLVALLTGIFSGCQRVTFIPGASYGYYIWEEDGIHISWSIDRKDASFSGSIITDGTIDDVGLTAWEEQDALESDGGYISYTSNLGPEDYMDGIIVKIDDYTYIEFDLRINESYDLSRVHVGAFLNNPSESPFRIVPRYFDEVSDIPWFKRHPFSGFFSKLFANKYFTFSFLFIIGVVIIEIIRITVFSGRKHRKLYTGIAYILLICLEIVVYFILRYLVL